MTDEGELRLDFGFKIFVNAKHSRRHRDVRDEQRTGCAGREEICEGERVDIWELACCWAIETTCGVQWWYVHLEQFSSLNGRGVFSLRVLDVLVNSLEFGDTDTTARSNQTVAGLKYGLSEHNIAMKE